LLISASLVTGHEDIAHPGISAEDSKSFEGIAVEAFQQYIRIRTDQPHPKYLDAIEFLKHQADSFGFEYEVLEMRGKQTADPLQSRPVFVITYAGTESWLPGVVFYSHMDVVPADETKWLYEPFSAHKDEQGRIYGRGTQDMKSVGIQHLYALARLQQTGFIPRRNIFVVFCNDEEIGGTYGMQKFLRSKKWQAMNVGVVIDEGLASPDDNYVFFYGERTPWWGKVSAQGPPGHGSRYIPGTAMEKTMNFLKKLMDLRDSEVAKMKSEGKRLGDIVTINLSFFKGGVTKDGGETYSMNVIPGEAQAGFDMRVTPSADIPKLDKQIRDWAEECGVELEFVSGHHLLENPYTELNEDNIWWTQFQITAKRLNLTLDPQIFPAATDSRFVRLAGYPALGFSPMPRTPILLHDHNEYIEESIFLQGILTYQNLMADLANVPPPPMAQLGSA